MLSTALLLLSLSSVSAQLQEGASYSELARQVTARFPGATVSRGVNHELFTLLEAEAGAQHVDLEPALGELRRFVRVEPGPHDAKQVLDYVKTLQVEPGAYIVVPAMPGLPPPAP